jgi:hypothetical protein
MHNLPVDLCMGVCAHLLYLVACDIQGGGGTQRVADRGEIDFL